MTGTQSSTHRYTVTLADLAEQRTAVVRGQVAHDGVGEFLGGVYPEVAAAVAAQGTGFAGAPFARYDFADGGFAVEAGFPVTGTVRPAGRVEPSALPAGRVARTLHRGPYAEVAAAYQALEGWIVDNGYEAAGAPWESYLDEPGTAEPRTEVYYPCRAAHR